MKKTGSIRLGLLLTFLLFLAACGDSATWEEHNAGTVTLRTSTNRLSVEQECKRRGVVAPTDGSVYGCTDFKDSVIVSVPQMVVLAHELCHWTRWTADHALCPTPVMTAAK
jgi:hypothetical protein